MISARNESDRSIEEAARRFEATRTLRDALRVAIDAANRSERYAGQFVGEGDALGVYGHVYEALLLMGEGDACERFFNSCEWPTD